MNRKSHASLEFLGYPIAAKLLFGEAVIAGLTNNSPAFPSPPVAITVLQTQLDDLRAKSVNAASGDHYAVQAMHLSEKAFDTSLTSNARYVTMVAGGVEATVLLSGYKSTVTETKPTVPTGVFTGLKAVSNVPGHIDIEFDPMPQADGFTFLVYTKGSPFAYAIINNQISITNAAGLLSIKSDTHRKVSFEGLTPRIDAIIIGFGVNNAGIGAITVFPDVFIL